ncbi:type II toxin-antitoxin system PemK/MazF family toxin [Mycolicibacter minnesotensis]
MASPRKSPWQQVQRFAEHLVFDEAPRLIRQLEQAPLVQQRIQRGIEQGIKVGLELLGGAAAEQPSIPAGRPVTDSSAPTAHRARRLVYAPDLDGRADPGEIVWTWVAFDDEPGKDRPVLVVGRDGDVLLGLMLSSRERRTDDADWVGIGAGSWDVVQQLGWVRLDRVLNVPEESIRREGAVLERTAFEVVAARLHRDYSWT